MDVLIINWSGFGLIALFLWRAITTTKRDLQADMAYLRNDLTQRIDKRDETMNHRFDKVEEGQAELKEGQAELKVDVAVLKAGQEALKAGQDDLKTDLVRTNSRLDSMGDTIIHIARGLGEVTGELKRIAPRERSQLAARSRHNRRDKPT